MARAHRHEKARARGAEALEDLGEEIGADGEGGGDLEGAPAVGLEIVHGLAGEGGRVEELLGGRAQGASGGREPEAARAPVEEAHAQRGLEGLDAGAHRGLGHPQRLRGPPEPPEGPDGEEGLDLGDLHAIRISDRADKRNQVARGREP